MSESVVRTDGLRVGYGRHAVVDGVDIDALRGSMICLLGPNGAGKSTILRTLSSMLAPVSGSVFIDNINIRNIRKSSLAKRMAVVLTERLQPGLMTAFEIASMGRHPYTGFFGKLKTRDKEVVMDALCAVNAQNLAERYFNELSDGEKQKVMIARALAQEPELIVLDEPTSHLDIRHRVEVVNILAELCREKGITVIMALHDIDLAIKGCQTVLMIKDNRVVAQGAPENIVNHGVIQSLYDIKDARYDDLLGSLEFGAAHKSSSFVIGGGGTGIPVYRAIKRAGIGMDSGVLHKSDVDAHVAKALCNTVVLEDDFSPISDGHFNEAGLLVGEHDTIIDTGFPIGETNLKNTDLLRIAMEHGKMVYSLRRPDTDILKNDSIIYFDNTESLVHDLLARGARL